QEVVARVAIGEHAKPAISRVEDVVARTAVEGDLAIDKVGALEVSEDHDIVAAAAEHEKAFDLVDGQGRNVAIDDDIVSGIAEDGDLVVAEERAVNLCAIE